MKKGRHRRFEEARAERGPDIDIEAILDDPFAPTDEDDDEDEKDDPAARWMASEGE